MPVASRETLGDLHGKVTDSLLAYVKGTPPLKRRATYLALIRRLLSQSGYRHVDEAPARARKVLDALYTAHVKGLLAQVQSGNAKPGVIAEAGLFLRSQGVNADSIEAARNRSKATASKAHSGAHSGATALTVVPNQSLPFTAHGTRHNKATT